MATKLLLIYTGGTIGMAEDPLTGVLKPVDFDHLMAQIPELKRFNYQIDTHSFSDPIDSSNMAPEVWGELAKLIAHNYNSYDGFVVLHGSDTMAYTASALSFMLKNLGKPVVLTGSQLPIGMIRTDGKENLITAIEIAAAQKDGYPTVPEVSIYFEYQLYRGNRTKKISATHFEAFDSPNYPVLAQAGIDIAFNTDDIMVSSKKKLELCTTFGTNITVLKLFPGITQATVNQILGSETAQVVIIESYGSGNMPTYDWFIAELEVAASSGKHLINITQCLRGSVTQGAYETSALLNKAGVISGLDMTLETALCKAMYLLGQKSTKFAKEFVTPICGELTPVTR